MNTLTLSHNLKWFAAHIEDDAMALKVSRALLNCTPAHALMELVRNDGLDQRAAATAYKAKYATGGRWSLAAAEQSEIQFECDNGI